MGGEGACKGAHFFLTLTFFFFFLFSILSPLSFPSFPSLLPIEKRGGRPLPNCRRFLSLSLAFFFFSHGQEVSLCSVARTRNRLKEEGKETRNQWEGRRR